MSQLRPWGPLAGRMLPENQARMQHTPYDKNLAAAGGTLYIACARPGRLSLDIS